MFETFKLFWGQFDETSRGVTQGQSCIVWGTWLGLCVDPSEVFLSQQLPDELSVFRFSIKFRRWSCKLVSNPTASIKSCRSLSDSLVRYRVTDQGLLIVWKMKGLLQTTVFPVKSRFGLK